MASNPKTPTTKPACLYPFRRRLLRSACAFGLAATFLAASDSRAEICHPMPPADALTPAGKPGGTAAAAQQLHQAYDDLNRGDFGAAACAALEAASLYTGAGDYAGRTDALRIMAAAEQGQGLFSQSQTTLGWALDSVLQAKDISREIAVRSSLGASLTFTRDYLEALTSLNQAIALADKTPGSDRVRAGILNNLGNLAAARVGTVRRRFKQTTTEEKDDLRSADDLQQEALKDFHAAADAANRAGDAVLAAKALVNAAVAAQRDRQLDEASKLIDQAAEAVRPLPDSHDKAYMLATLGRVAQQLPSETRGAEADAIRTDAKQPTTQQTAILLETAAALDTEAALAARNSNDPRAEAYATGYLADVYAAQGKAAQALPLSRRAAFIAQQCQSPDSLYRWQWQTARLLRSQWVADGAPAGAKRDAVLAAYQHAVETLRPIRSDVALGYGNGDTRSSFRTVVGPVYFELADLLLRRAADETVGSTEQRADLKAARDTVERLKSGELEDYFQDPCVNQLRTKERQIGAIETKTAIVYVIPLQDRVELLMDLPTASEAEASAGGGLMRISNTRVNAAQLEDAVDQFRVNLEEGDSNDYVEQSIQLYDWLISPIKSVLTERKITTLVFVPDGALRKVPMGALRDRDAKQFLVEQYAVAVTPGLTLMEPHQLNRRNVRLLLSGLSEARQNFPALPSVAGEIATISRAFPTQSISLLNQQYVLPAVQSQVKTQPYNIVHFASHGEFHGDARQTFILTYDDRLTLDGLQRLIQPKQFKNEPVELLTLSACKTAAGDDRAALGLAGVAIKAGARSAVASLWSVNDQASSSLIADFYQELKDHPEYSKVQAMQAAQLKLVHSAGGYSHPLYWAPFLVIGNWL